MCKWWKKQPVLVKLSYIGLFIIIILFIIYYSLLEKKFRTLDDISIEMWGFVFDILLFGLILGLVTNKYDKQKEIKTLRNELEFIRGWHEPEAGYKMRNIIKRLLDFEEVVKVIDIKEAYINTNILKFLKDNNIEIFELDSPNYDIRNFFFHKMRFEKLELNLTGFVDCVFDSVNFYTLDLKSIIFMNCEFINCYFFNIDFNKAELLNLKFHNCSFRGGNANKIRLLDVELNNCEYTFFSRDYQESLSEKPVKIPNIKKLNLVDFKGTLKDLFFNSKF